MAGREESTSESEIERLAYAIWESEGRPEGRDHEHWMRAKEMLAAGQVAPADDPTGARPVQPGFEDVPPGIVPDMKERPEDDLKEGSGGRFAQQLDELPQQPGKPKRQAARPGEGPGPEEPLPAGYE